MFNKFRKSSNSKKEDRGTKHYSCPTLTKLSRLDPSYKPTLIERLKKWLSNF